MNDVIARLLAVSWYRQAGCFVLVSEGALISPYQNLISENCHLSPSFWFHHTDKAVFQFSCFKDVSYNLSCEPPASNLCWLFWHLKLMSFFLPVGLWFYHTTQTRKFQVNYTLSNKNVGSPNKQYCWAATNSNFKIWAFNEAVNVSWNAFAYDYKHPNLRITSGQTSMASR